ncbi:MAG: hypothetical protein IJX14_00050 [Clostridia bacterium]|nr:hypothetical protein [Clostridia bacterium]
MKKQVEKMAEQMGTNALAASIVKTILYWLLVVVLWFGYSYLWQRPLTHPSAIAFTIPLVIPFVWPKIHERWAEKNWTGTVVQMKDVEEIRITGRGSRKLFTHLHITFRTAEGSEKIVFHEGQEYKIANGYYHMGDEVWKLKCLKYPINMTDEAERTEDIFCPKCGRFTNASKKKCHWCRKPLLK